jgi:hypothetical protein
MGIFEFIAFMKLAMWLVVIAAGLYIVKTIVGWVTGGIFAAKVARTLKKSDDITWQK